MSLSATACQSQGLDSTDGNCVESRPTSACEDQNVAVTACHNDPPSDGDWEVRDSASTCDQQPSMKTRDEDCQHPPALLLLPEIIRFRKVVCPNRRSENLRRGIYTLYQMLLCPQLTGMTEGAQTKPQSQKQCLECLLETCLTSCHRTSSWFEKETGLWGNLGVSDQRTWTNQKEVIISVFLSEFMTLTVE